MKLQSSFAPYFCVHGIVALKSKWNLKNAFSAKNKCCSSFYKLVITSISISVLLLYTSRTKSVWICVDYNVFVCLVHPLPMFSYAMSLLFGGKTISRKTQRSKYIHIIIISLCTLSSLFLWLKATFEWSDLLRCEEQSRALVWWDRTTSRSRWTADLSMMMNLRKIAD